MKLATLALVAATIALPATAFAEGMQQQKAGDSSVPGATNPNTSGAKAKTGTTGAGAADSSVPGATSPTMSNAKAKPGTSGAAAKDSSIPGASNADVNKPKR
ncbi:MAG: hypothetical protein NTV56_25675 [Alphaproteobacteria bacterium]|nr:hypothetical protein [Alphaproteobacteria bacterium]